MRGKSISEGTTPDGRRVQVFEDFDAQGYVDRFTVLVDGAEVEITGLPSRLRDGGTTTIPTSAGEVHLPRRIGRNPGPDTLDGEPYACL